MCFEGPEEELTRTRNVQPAVLTMSIACLQAARQQSQLPEASFTAGHSLGEYTALITSGVLGFRDALKLVAIRGKLMEDAAESTPGGMIVLIGASEEIAENICRLSDTEISNINSPQQIVISGPMDKLEVATALARENGVRKIIPLKVSGAFHSRLMASAADGLKSALSDVSYNQAVPPIIANTSAQPLTNKQQIKQELETQLVKPVLWQKSVQYMYDKGVATFIEFGPGEVLTGLVRRIIPDAKLHNVNSINNVNNFLG